MGQDIRKMFSKEEQESSTKLRPGHQGRFSAKLEQSFPIENRKSNFYWMKIAAVLVVALGVGFVLLSPPNFNGEPEVVSRPVEEKKEEAMPEKQFQLRDVSPEFQKIENYYMASLNMELANLEVNENNKGIVDSFMNQLSELDKEYKRLNAELGKYGPNEQTIEAMISNLQLRLQLLQRVKNKIKEVKQTKNNNYGNVQV